MVEIQSSGKTTDPIPPLTRISHRAALMGHISLCALR